MSEATLQRYLIKKVKNLGGLALKMECSSRRGFPDLIVVLPNCWPVLVEMKSDTGRGRLSEHQIRLHDELCELGTKVEVVSSKAEVDALLAD